MDTDGVYRVQLENTFGSFPELKFIPNLEFIRKMPGNLPIDGLSPVMTKPILITFFIRHEID